MRILYPLFSYTTDVMFTRSHLAYKVLRVPLFWVPQLKRNSKEEVNYESLKY